MSVYASKVFGLTDVQRIDLIAFSTIFAIAGSIISGYISDIVGYRRSMLGIFFLWGLCLLGGSLLSKSFCWLIGALVGITLGSTWVVSRVLILKLVHGEKVGEAFGLFSLVGYISGIVGPLFWTFILLYLSRQGEVGYRIALLSLIMFIVVGFVLLLRVKNIPKSS